MKEKQIVYKEVYREHSGPIELPGAEGNDRRFVEVVAFEPHGNYSLPPALIQVRTGYYMAEDWETRWMTYEAYGAKLVRAAISVYDTEKGKI